MDAYLKRKHEDDGSGETKKPKIEICPHAERCYRRNPHHFREYDHPHLTELLKQGSDFQLPDGFPQDRKVVAEQLDVFKSLQPVREPIKRSPQKSSPQKNSLQKNSSQNSKGSSPNSSKSTSPSSSTSAFSKHLKNDRASNRVSSRNKTTTFVPDSGSASNSASASNSLSKITTSTSSKAFPKGCMREKMEKAAPYNLFFTKVPDSKATLDHENAISFPELLCPSLGDLKCSIQINFMIDIAWLMEQYNAQGQGKKPLTILYGDEWPDMEKYIQLKLPNVTPHFVKMKDPFGTHHSKIGLYSYEDGSLRVVVSTANLYFEDWNYYNQGLWISPALPRLSDDSPEHVGTGPTGFKTTLLSYLRDYKLPILKDWIDCVRKADFSEVKVFLVTSVPGKHYPKSTGSHVHRVGDLLSRHCVLPAKTTPQSEGPLSWGVLAQASSIGSMGKSPADWLRGVLLRSLASHKQGPLPANSNATLNLVYPSVENVMNSYYGAKGGGCLPYSKATNEKQRWLQDYLHQWKSDHLQRSRNMPHIKTYCRVSPCLSKLAYFLITSANLSKAAWGNSIQKDQGTYVRSYEVGVMFLPSFFGEDYFHIRPQEDSDRKLFPFIYDLPLTPFKASDYPWCN